MKHSKLSVSSSSSVSKAQSLDLPSQPQASVTQEAIADNASRIAKRIKQWSAAQPELTRILCDYVTQYSPQVTDENPEQIVDLIVEKEIAHGWEKGLAAAHLSEIEKTIVQDSRKDSALILYIQILQRGKVSVNRDNLEQAVLLNSGLVKAKDGYLQVANALYKKAFSLEKVEQMLPGITKPVKIIPSVDNNGDRPSRASALYSKAAVIICGLAIVAASISSYIRESGGRALATSSDEPNAQPELVANTFENLSESTSDATPGLGVEAAMTDRELFDRGENHAINSRWVLMMRDFCSIPETSLYYTPAQNQVDQLFKLYAEDIQLARDVVQTEKAVSCPM